MFSEGQNDEIFLAMVASGEMTVSKDGKFTRNKRKLNGCVQDIKRRKYFSLHIKLREKSKAISCQRLVWLVFNGELPKGYIVSQKDESDITNVALDNLFIETRGERTKRTISPEDLQKRSLKMIQLGKDTKKIPTETVAKWRRMAKSGQCPSYRKLGGEIDPPVSKSAVLFAILGRSHKDCPEPPLEVGEKIPDYTKGNKKRERSRTPKPKVVKAVKAVKPVEPKAPPKEPLIREHIAVCGDGQKLFVDQGESKKKIMKLLGLNFPPNRVVERMLQDSSNMMGKTEIMRFIGDCLGQ